MKTAGRLGTRAEGTKAGAFQRAKKKILAVHQG
jgi:hypothetical protein